MGACSTSLVNSPETTKQGRIPFSFHLKRTHFYIKDVPNPLYGPSPPVANSAGPAGSDAGSVESCDLHQLPLPPLSLFSVMETVEAAHSSRLRLYFRPELEEKSGAIMLSVPFIERHECSSEHCPSSLGRNESTNWANYHVPSISMCRRGQPSADPGPRLQAYPAVSALNSVFRQ